ncbi:MAG TPA: low affinity iron permease family protein [Thermoanaerobaculia bacterium]
MKRKIRRSWEMFARQATQWSGRPAAFGIAVAIVVMWLATGPIFHFSDTWQLVINTGTTVVTFLMVFLIQHAQNKDTRAIELKLNELVAAMPGASNRMIDVEALSEEDLDMLHRYFRKLVSLAKKDVELTTSHSVEEAAMRHARKKKELAITIGSVQPPSS